MSDARVPKYIIDFRDHIDARLDRMEERQENRNVAFDKRVRCVENNQVKISAVISTVITTIGLGINFFLKRG